ncbi:MAG: D-cysteine desulfhydrase family protein [Vicinamibacterales bacterium]|jgi:D-cysteine desulfhydrase|nr:D-cysteine desulfhydrase [Acidobacteriota bacterium]MDP7210614.1 D-cysteine desulfhydrase family protein [Vicinamibacterales bacterium]HJO17360.1 D-cysteine desulfhydrase family protein [Vicinamibacterales bacterium]|tara:strand:- start:1802 stop:2845 length:1044 start_codon:yes stop_codon:yes gene_type:complete
MTVTKSIQQVLAKYPRNELIRTPTPLVHLKHLSERLDVDLFIKRDDLTDLALGGDKPRKLEYETAKANSQGATVLVTCGSAQSNHARLTTAAARKLGLKSALVLSSDELKAFQSNLLTVYLMGAEVRFVETRDHWDLESHALAFCEELRLKGERPYYIPVSGTTPTSCLGYVRAGLELVDQFELQDIRPDAVYIPFGTGGIFTSTLLALRECGVECPLIGISVNASQQKCEENLVKWWAGICRLLDVDPDRSREGYEIHDGYIGQEYGDATEGCLDGLMLMAETEGILLDPVYSAKVFSGLLAHHAAGRWPSGTRLVFIHSGGTPALFAYHDKIKQHLIKRGRIIDA